MTINACIVVELDTTVAVIDMGLAVMIELQLDAALAMVEVAIAVLVVSDADPDCETTEDGAHIVATTYHWFVIGHQGAQSCG